MKNDKQNPPQEEEFEMEDQKQETESTSELSEAEEMKMHLEALEIKCIENMDGWQRSQAEFSNYKKRVDRDQEKMQQDLKGKIIKRYLEILDDLERALTNKPHDDEGQEWARGIELVYRKLKSYMDAEGVVEMDVTAGIFDPNMHEAIAQEVSENHESGEIIEILQSGYMIGNRVLRPAVVKVAE